MWYEVTIELTRLNLRPPHLSMSATRPPKCIENLLTGWYFKIKRLNIYVHKSKYKGIPLNQKSLQRSNICSNMVLAGSNICSNMAGTQKKMDIV